MLAYAQVRLANLFTHAATQQYLAAPQTPTCVLTLVQMCPHTPACVRIFLHVSSYSCMCPHTLDVTENSCSYILQRTARAAYLSKHKRQAQMAERSEKQATSKKSNQVKMSL